MWVVFLEGWWWGWLGCFFVCFTGIFLGGGGVVVDLVCKVILVLVVCLVGL